MIIAINDLNSFSEKPVPHFIDGDAYQSNPKFSQFSLIYWVDMESRIDDTWSKNLDLIVNASVSLDLLLISNIRIHDLCKSHKDKINKLQIDYLSFKKIWFCNIRRSCSSNKWNKSKNS